MRTPSDLARLGSDAVRSAGLERFFRSLWPWAAVSFNPTGAMPLVPACHPGQAAAHVDPVKRGPHTHRKVFGYPASAVRILTAGESTHPEW